LEIGKNGEDIIYHPIEIETWVFGKDVKYFQVKEEMNLYSFECDNMACETSFRAFRLIFTNESSDKIC